MAGYREGDIVTLKDEPLTFLWGGEAESTRASDYLRGETVNVIAVYPDGDLSVEGGKYEGVVSPHHVAEPDTIPGSDAIQPNHYQFPGGRQVIEISRHLTSNGGQAVQYIARSTRSDGVNKHTVVDGQVEDLRKAIVFLNDEIARLMEIDGVY